MAIECQVIPDTEDLLFKRSAWPLDHLLASAIDVYAMPSDTIHVQVHL